MANAEDWLYIGLKSIDTIEIKCHQTVLITLSVSQILIYQ